MKILSLDTSTKTTGYAVYDGSTIVHYSSIDKSPIKDTNDRLRAMIGQIFALITRYCPEVVVVEETVVPRNPQTQRMLTMILGAIFGECNRKSIHYCALRPTQWRSAVKNDDEKLPKKREELKEWSVEKVRELYGITDIDDNVSDAILIGLAYTLKYT